MKIKFQFYFILTIIFIGLLIYSAFTLFKDSIKKDSSDSHVYKTSGRIEGTEYQAISKVSGTVRDFIVEEGATVTKGQKIAVISIPQLQLQIIQAKSNFRRAVANLKFLQNEYARNKTLAKQNLISTQTWQEAERNYLTAKEDVVIAQNEVNKLMADLNDTVIYAPISGQIVSKIVHPGEVISSGVPLVTMINMDDLYLKIFIPTEMIGKIQVGDEALIYPDSLPNTAFTAKVKKINSKAEFTPKNIETKSQRANMVFEVKLKIIDNKERKLKPGMPAEAQINLSEKEQPTK